MSKIKFKLVKFDKRLCFEVLEQIPLPNGYTFAAKNGITINAYYPILEHVANNKNLYIRSTEEPQHNNRYSTLGFKDNTERDMYYKLIVESLQELSNKI